MLLIGSRHRRGSCSEAYRFARSRASQPTRRSTSTSRTPLMGFIDHLSADTTVAASTPARAVAQASVRDCHIPNVFRSCRSSRLQRFPPQRADPKIRPFDSLRVCCTPQPAMGFTTFRTPWSASRPSRDPKVVDPKVQGSLPQWRIPFEAFPSSTAFDHAVTALRPFGLSRVHRLACPLAVSSHARYRVATVRCSARRPQGFLPSRSPLQARDVSAARPLDAPLGFGSTRSDAAARFAPPRHAGRFALRANRFGVPDPNVRGRQGVSALSGSVRPTVGLPRREDRVRSRWLRHLPKEAPRPHPTWAPKESVGCRWISPEEDPPRRSNARRRRVADVIATHLRRDSCATQCSLRRAAPVVRASALRPLALARVHDGEPARRGRPHPEVRSSARHSRAPRRALRSNLSAGIPKDSDRAASRGNPKVTLGGSWLRRTPASWRAGLGPDSSFVITGTAESRSRRTGTPSDPKTGEPAPKRRGAVGGRTSHTRW